MHSPVLPASSATRPASGPGQARLRRLRPEDIVVVPEQPVRRAIGGTVVGNFMEWFDFGIYGYLTVVMTTVFTAGLSHSAGVLVGSCSARSATASAASGCCS